MKIERLIGILSVLLQKEKVTAPKLAEKFEVSPRTIQTLKIYARLGFPFVQFREVAEEFASWMAIGWTGHC